MDTRGTLRKMSSTVNSISFFPSPHAAESFDTGIGFRISRGEDPSLAFLRGVAPEQHLICTELLHTSLPKDAGAMRDIRPEYHGFVDIVLEAYNNHRALVVRPDDVWIAILTQFYLFVNGNAEALRSAFVAHQGKRELVITSAGNRYTMDPAYIADRMTELMQGHIIDPSLREWIMPNFTTTTATDKTVSAILMLAAMKEYFSLKASLLCGIPRVTIEGEKSDWEEILRRPERLKKYGIQTNTWYHLLRPIISRFVAAYDDPNSPENLDFWRRVAHWSTDGSGESWLTGWITAFCVFNEDGKWEGNRFIEKQVKKGKDASRLNAEQFASAYIHSESTPHLTLDGFPYPTINGFMISRAYAFVDLKLDDNGVLLDTMFVTGLVGLQICSTDKTEGSPNGTRDTVRPLPVWWYFVKNEEHGAATWHSRRTIRTPPSPPTTTQEATTDRRSFYQDVVLKMKGTWNALRRK